MTSDARPQTAPTPTARVAADKPSKTSPAYSEAPLAGEVEDAAKHEPVRTDANDETGELASEQIAESQDSVT